MRVAASQYIWEKLGAPIESVEADVHAAEAGARQRRGLINKHQTIGGEREHGQPRVVGVPAAG